MPKAYDLEIASLLIRVSSTGSIIFQDGNDPAYQTFLNVLQGEKKPDISIALSIDPLPDSSRAEILFDSSESWTMFRSSSGYSLSFHPPEFSKPFWKAVMNQSFTDVTVFCDKDLLQTPNGDGIANPVRYPLDQILLMHYLSSKKGLIVHAAGIEIQGKGYIFAGRSGAGKTTISRQFISREFGKMLSDDRVIIRKIDDALMVFGTPWPGEGGIAVNRGVPLGGIFFLAKSDTNTIEKISPITTVEKLLPVASIPWYDPEPMSNIFAFCDDLIAHIPCHILHFKPDAGVVDMFEKFVA